MTGRILDHSLLSTVTHCERLAFYRYIQRLDPVEGSPRLEAGSAGHKALAVIYREGFGEIEEAVRVLRDNYRMKPLGDLSYLTANHLEIILRNYVDFYEGRDPWKVQEVVEEPLVSEAGTILPFPFGGIPDLIVEDTEDGVRAVADHKFTTGYFANKITLAQMQKQGPLYVLLAREVLGFSGNRMIFNIIGMKEKCSEPGFSGQRFERKVFDYTADQLEEARRWAQEAEHRWTMLRTLVEIADGSEEAAVQNPGVHCKFCDYQELCSAKNRRLRESKKRTKFRVGSEPEGLLLSGADG